MRMLPSLTAFPEGGAHGFLNRCECDINILESLQADPIENFDLRIMATCMCLGCSAELPQIASKIERLRIREASIGMCAIDDPTPIPASLSKLVHLKELQIESWRHSVITRDVAASFQSLKNLTAFHVKHVKFEPEGAVLSLAESLAEVPLQTLELNCCFRQDSDLLFSILQRVQRRHRLKLFYVHFELPIDWSTKKYLRKIRDKQVAEFLQHVLDRFNSTSPAVGAVPVPQTYIVNVHQNANGASGSLINGFVGRLSSYGLCSWDGYDPQWDWYGSC